MVKRSLNTSSTKVKDDLGVFNRVFKVPAPLKEKQIYTIPWVDEGVLKNVYGGING